MTQQHRRNWQRDIVRGPLRRCAFAGGCARGCAKVGATCGACQVSSGSGDGEDARGRVFSIRGQGHRSRHSRWNTCTHPAWRLRRASSRSEPATMKHGMHVAAPDRDARGWHSGAEGAKPKRAWRRYHNIAMQIFARWGSTDGHGDAGGHRRRAGGCRASWAVEELCGCGGSR